MSASAASGGGGGGAASRRRAIVWLWRELRVADNEALRVACGDADVDEIAVLFVADEQLVWWDGDDLDFLHDALATLRAELRARGSELWLRVGRSASEVSRLAEQLGARTVYCVRSGEFEVRWREAALVSALSALDVSLRTIPDAALREHKYGANDRYSRSSRAQREPLWLPERLPPSPHSASALPPGDLLAAMQQLRRGASVEHPSARPSKASYMRGGEEEDDRRCCGGTLMSAQEAVAEGELPVRRLVKQRQADTFRAMRRALHFGCISLRQMARGGARMEAEAKEWHRGLSVRDGDAGRPWRYWLWRGCVVRYCVEGAVDDAAAPTVLFVHGFGASLQHWEKNVRGLSARRRLKLYALDLLGFGRAEKPRTHYTQHLWEAQLEAFVREVVRQPVVVVGNSIGGYFSACFASDFYPSLCSGLVLVNTAGVLNSSKKVGAEEGRTAVEKPAAVLGTPAARNAFALTASRGIIFALQPQIGRILRNLYPVGTDQVTPVLIAEIYRNSTDPGAAYVIESGSRLPPRRSLDELFAQYGGPLLVLQGGKDPLTNSDARFRALMAAFDSADGELLDAGHCPHDETPEIFNDLLLAWIFKRVKSES